MPHFLLELLSEEIPSNIQHWSANTLKKIILKQLSNKGLIYKISSDYWTSRRITLYISDLEYMKNFDDCHLYQDFESKKNIQDILLDVIPNTIRNFPWKKSMRWGKNSLSLNSLKWIRPLRSILCLLINNNNLQSEIISFEIDGIQSGNITYGHRFMKKKQPIIINNFSEYFNKLKSYNVILSEKNRKEIIVSSAKKICEEYGLIFFEDKKLLEDIVGLVEWPVVLIGMFSKKFLVLPEEVIRITMKKHQKCFVTHYKKEEKSISNYFILVSNIQTQDQGKKIIYDNTLVVQARLSDALYFWKKDQSDLSETNKLYPSSVKLKLNLNKPLDQRMALLDHLQVVFHDQLGTQGDRISRISKLAIFIASFLNADINLVYRAVVLSKADLQTHLVHEFPDLQGFIGRQYATLQGENIHVSEAIEEHYFPKSTEDCVPKNIVAITVSLADKIDTLVGFWLIEKKPTSSKDPYALRRITLGIIRILICKKNNVHLIPIFQKSISLIKNEIPNIIDKKMLEKNIIEDLLKFIHERFKNYLYNQKTRPDIVEVIFQKKSDNLSKMINQLNGLSRFIETENGKKMCRSAKRIINILHLECEHNFFVFQEIDKNMFELQEEFNLYNSIVIAEKQIIPILETEEFSLILSLLSPLRKSIDIFFEKVFINVKNHSLKTNRLSLVYRINIFLKKILDFSKIVI